jgi:hypothetical protein
MSEYEPSEFDYELDSDEEKYVKEYEQNKKIFYEIIAKCRFYRVHISHDSILYMSKPVRPKWFGSKYSLLVTVNRLKIGDVPETSWRGLRSFDSGIQVEIIVSHMFKTTTTVIPLSLYY